ncbi:hypothetical protein [Aliivibrio sp. S4MY3]
MSLFRQQSVWDIANQLDIVLPDKQRFVVQVLLFKRDRD